MTPRAKISSPQTPEQRSAVGRFLRFCLENKLLVAMATTGIALAGILVAPFDWNLGGIQRRPVPVDAIPDIGENQQIVFTRWPGRSPQDVEDQIGYPLTVSLLGIPGVKTIRSYSMFGFSTIYVIFKDSVEFYWGRTRILEKLNSLPPGTLPSGVKPRLGPDATALGEVFWYTLEGRDPQGRPTGGWEPQELRTLQDWYIRYWLLSVDGVADVGSVGGYVKEYQVDVDPDAMRAYGVSLDQVYRAVRAANLDVGAKTLEINRVEYFIRGIGFIKTVRDIENSVVKVRADNVPVLVKNVARVALGPASRRGALDKGGAPAVGGVVVARFGQNPLAVIQRIHEKIRETRLSLPAKVLIDDRQVRRDQVKAFAARHGFRAYVDGAVNQRAWLEFFHSAPPRDRPKWATLSRVAVVPFYDRSGLIYETLATLNDAIAQEIMITILVVLIMMLHLRTSVLISAMLPLDVLLCFVCMKFFGVQANIVALSGIAIAIGAIVDMGIVLSENIVRHLKLADPGEPRLEVIHRAASEVGSAVLTAVSTTVISFLPVFTMTGPEGKLFKPLAYTKTFALAASILIALTVLPPAALVLFRLRDRRCSPRLRTLRNIGIVLGGGALGFAVAWWAGIVIALFGIYLLSANRLPPYIERLVPIVATVAVVLIVGMLLARYWEPLGSARGFLRNLIFVAALVGGLLGGFKLFQVVYAPLLRWCLRFKGLVLGVPLLLVVFGGAVWLGFDRLFGWLPPPVRAAAPGRFLARVFPGLGKEFMPALDEGSFLFMPTTMPHASIGEALDILAEQDRRIRRIPEIQSVVGKLGRADTPLDPAPISMFETIINYKPEYKTDAQGRRIRFRYDRKHNQFVRDNRGRLIPDPGGRPYRQWRESIRSPNDIWAEIVRAAQMPGVTSAPKLQPIAARIVMLQSGMRAPMGIKIKGPNIDDIEKVGLRIEHLLKRAPGVEPNTVIADRIVGKPYLEIIPDRRALARYGIPIRKFQDVVETAVGGRTATTTIEGRERYAVRVRYPRELRNSIESLAKILVPGPGIQQIPITQLAQIRYTRGPQVIKSEDTFLVGYVVFDKKPGLAEVDVVDQCRKFLANAVRRGELVLPAGVTYTFAGSYENQVHAAKTLALVLPVALLLIFSIIYLQFRSVPTTLLIFSGIFVAWAGGFLLLWLYAQPWFLDFHVFGVSMRDLFQIHPINLSVAVWVGFLALFGIASDNGVIQAAYLDQVFRDRTPRTRDEIREAAVIAAQRRIRPCLMTSATTILALLPVLTSTGRGSDVMVPMAIPSFGGMLVVLISIFVVPILYCSVKEWEARFRRR